MDKLWNLGSNKQHGDEILRFIFCLVYPQLGAENSGKPKTLIDSEKKHK